MPFADHDDVVKALPSNRADHALGISVCHGERGAMTTSPMSNVFA